ncbi:MAG TPA: BTAD domain-containing putative transcriptional regulator [Gemmatimonadaceae bacterium]|nr:BTAD domain-containing putative transcriptional regulator [Gemmatimonadaceae bacterium]
MYRLRTLGGAALLRDGQPMDAVSAQRKLLALLALLALARQRGISRDRIASYLWPESDMERARGALKQSLHVLRRQLGSPNILLGTAELRLNPQQIGTDVEEFLAAIEMGDAARAVELYGGPFLDGFHLPGAAEFELWADAQRAALGRQHVDALEALARAAHHRGAYGDAAGMWRRVQAEDRFNARAVVGLMEALDANGERASALRAAQTYEALIREEFGSEADPAVTSLARRLRSDPPRAPEPSSTVQQARSTSEPAQAEAHEAPAARAAQRTGSAWALGAAVLLFAAVATAAVWLTVPRNRPSPPHANSVPEGSVAVLPFVNTGDQATDEHFSDGLTDELISMLGRVQGLRVSARTSTFALKGKGLSPRAIADTLGVASVLEGTVRRHQDRLKITVQLVDPRDESVLWSDVYDRQLEDVFAVQEEIASAIAGALRGQLPTRPGATSTRRPTNDLEAYDLYLRGRYNWDVPPQQRLRQSAIYYRRAVERDPAFALAYAGLAETYVNLAVYAYMPASEALARANVAAERALELNSGLAEALTARAYVHLFELDFDAAAADLRRAIEVNPNYPVAHHFFSLLLMMMDRPDEAVPYNRHALLLDPLSLPANATRGIIQVQRGDYAAAVPELERALKLRPDFTLALYYLGVVHAAQGAYHRALDALQNAGQQAADYPGLPGALAFVLHQLGRTTVADSIVAALEGRADGDMRAQTNLAFAHAAMGRADAAFRMLDRVQWDVPALIGIHADPLLGGVRSDARYAELVRRLGARP